MTGKDGLGTVLLKTVSFKQIKIIKNQVNITNAGDEIYKKMTDTSFYVRDAVSWQHNNSVEVVTALFIS